MFIIMIFDYLRLGFHKTFYSRKRIESYQLKKIKKLIKYARNHSSFYEELYKDYVIKTWDDVRRLPHIDKQVMMEHFDQLNTENLRLADVMDYAINSELNKEWTGYYKDKFVVGLSSGTSGNKGIYVTPKAMTKRLPGVFLARGGFPLSLLPFRILFLLRVYSQGFDDINSRIIHLKYMSTMTDLEEVIMAINTDKINLLMAPPSFIRQLLPKSEQIKVKLKRIMTYAEVLDKEDKVRFEKAFQTKVIEIYQASEGQIASTCKCGHLHLNEDLVHVDIYDQDNQLINTSNQVGAKMVITNLVNYVQPLIRYEMGDMIVLDDLCECGSSFRRIKKILGRHDDLLYFTNKDGESIVIYPDLFVRWIIITSDSIREFQVIQNQVNCVDITVELLSDEETVIDILAKTILSNLAVYNVLKPLINIKQGNILLPKEKNKFKRFISYL